MAAEGGTEAVASATEATPQEVSGSMPRGTGGMCAQPNDEAADAAAAEAVDEMPPSSLKRVKDAPGSSIGVERQPSPEFKGDDATEGSASLEDVPPRAAGADPGRDEKTASPKASVAAVDAASPAFASASKAGAGVIDADATAAVGMKDTLPTSTGVCEVAGDGIFADAATASASAAGDPSVAEVSAASGATAASASGSARKSRFDMVTACEGEYSLRSGEKDLRGRYAFCRDSGLLTDQSSAQCLGRFSCDFISEEPLQVPSGAGNGFQPCMRIKDSEISAEIQTPSNAGALFVLPSQFNAAEYPSHAEINKHMENYKYDSADRPGPRGQLAVHPAAGQFLLDNACCQNRLGGISAVDELLSKTRDLEYGFDLVNGYLVIPQVASDEESVCGVDVLRRSLHQLRLLVMEDVPVRGGLTADYKAFCKEDHSVSLVYASAVPVRAYTNLCDATDDRQKNFQLQIARLLLVAQYYGALLHASRLATRRGTETLVFLMLLAGQRFNNPLEIVAQSMSLAVEMLSPGELKRLDIRVLTGRDNPEERASLTSLLSRHRKLVGAPESAEPALPAFPGSLGPVTDAAETQRSSQAPDGKPPPLEARAHTGRGLGCAHRWGDELPKIAPVPGAVVRVFCGVWNLHGKRAPEDITDWLGNEKHHIYVIGTCESERSITKSMVFPSKARWEQQVRDHLGEDYFMVGSQVLSAIHIMGFIHRYLWRYCWDIKSGQVATGFGNVMGNKGGAQVGFSLGRTSILFINAHLAAHAHKMEERTKNFTRILRDSPIRREKGGLGIHEEYDRVFFMGDLNPRVDATREDVDDWIRERHFKKCLDRDQLLVHLKADPGSAKSDGPHGLWPLFTEAEISFPPTYKFDADTDRYDTSKKKRIPSYTDRILWKRCDKHTRNLSYGSVPSLKCSDHRPIFGQFEILVDLDNWEGPDDYPRRGHKSSICAIQ